LYRLRDLTSISINEDEIRKVVGGYGYDSIKLAEGKRMVDELDRLNNEVTRRSIEKKKLFAKKKKMQTEIHKKYMKYIKLARIAFSNDVEAQEYLLLNGARARTYEKWHAQVVLFLKNLLSSNDYIKELNQFGVSLSDLEAVQKLLIDLDDVSSECMKITGVVRMLNHKIKKETVVIQRWISNYIKVARIAMEDNPKVKKLIKQAIGN